LNLQPLCDGCQQVKSQRESHEDMRHKRVGLMDDREVTAFHEAAHRFCRVS